MQTYIVQEGDTLYGISKQFGVKLEEIKYENDLKNNFIIVGQALKIPTTITTVLYIVKRGDTLYSIANRYGINVDDIIQINNLKSSVLYVGEQLKIPVSGSNISSGDNYFIYTVKSGDTLYSIAKKFDTTVSDIKAINSLSSDFLSLNQQLKLPISISTDSNNQNYQLYTVKSGDTLYSIASNYGMTVDQLVELNNLSNTTLEIGQLLKVFIMPEDSENLLGAECYGDSYVEPTYLTYVVKRGDSLYSIANRYGTTVNALISLNKLTSNLLSVGQILKIKEVN